MAVMTVIRFELPGLPPSQNKRRHHMVRYRDDQQWKGDTRRVLIDAVNRSGIKGLPWTRVHVRYNFHYPRVTLADADNLIGSMKPCLDGMKSVAFTDDNVTCIHDLSVRVDVVRKVPAGVVVVIEPCLCDATAQNPPVQTDPH